MSTIEEYVTVSVLRQFYRQFSAFRYSIIDDVKIFHPISYSVGLSMETTTAPSIERRGKPHMKSMERRV